MTPLPTRLPDAVLQMAAAIRTTFRKDDATHLMVCKPASVQVMHMTPSLWTRDRVRCNFGHDQNKCTTSIPLGILWWAYVDPSFENIRREQKLSMK